MALKAPVAGVSEPCQGVGMLVAEETEVGHEGFKVGGEECGEIRGAGFESPRVGDASDGQQVMREKEAEMCQEKCPRGLECVAERPRGGVRDGGTVKFGEERCIRREVVIVA